MADQVFMYAIVAGAFAVLTGILFGSRAKRKSEEKKSAAPASTSGERRGAIKIYFSYFENNRLRLPTLKIVVNDVQGEVLEESIC